MNQYGIKSQQCGQIIYNVPMQTKYCAMCKPIVQKEQIAKSIQRNKSKYNYYIATKKYRQSHKDKVQRIITEAWWRHPYRRGKKVKALPLSVGKIRACIEMMQVEMHRPTFFADRKERRGGIAFKNGFATVINGQVKLLPPLS